MPRVIHFASHTVVEMVGQSTERTRFPFDHALFYLYLLSHLQIFLYSTYEP